MKEAAQQRYGTKKREREKIQFLRKEQVCWSQGKGLTETSKQ